MSSEILRRLLGRRRISFTSGVAGLLIGFQDYVLFKDSVENIVAEGRFDVHWRLSEADLTKIKSSGAVK